MPNYIREAELTYRRRMTPHDCVEGLNAVLRTSSDVAPILRNLIGFRLTESLLVVAVSVKQRIIGFHEVARGSVSSCAVVPADVFRYPIIAGAPAVVIAHNHPSGEPVPSTEDLLVTRRVRQAGALLGITLLDHIIVSEHGYYSFLDAGRLGDGRWPCSGPRPGNDLLREPELSCASRPVTARPNSAGRSQRAGNSSSSSCGPWTRVTVQGRNRR
jgi:hypothetical protein